MSNMIEACTGPPQSLLGQLYWREFSHFLGFVVQMFMSQQIFPDANDSISQMFMSQQIFVGRITLYIYIHIYNDNNNNSHNHNDSTAVNNDAANNNNNDSH